jgi:hypothetical protein
MYSLILQLSEGWEIQSREIREQLRARILSTCNAGDREGELRLAGNADEPAGGCPGISISKAFALPAARAGAIFGAVLCQAIQV